MTDLHIHTSLSDGHLPIEDIADLAVSKGLNSVAVTDHDTLYNGAQSIRGLKIIPGVEMSAFDYKRGRRVHLLCYMWKNAGPLSEVCKNILSARRKAGEIMIGRVADRYPITEGFIYKRAERSASIYKQHIMKALMDAGYSTSVFGPLYDELFCSGSPVRENITYPDIYDVLSAAERSGAVKVLAHPPVYDTFELAEELAAGGYIDGIEVWHSRNKPGDAGRAEDIADRYGLIKTGGSDFHGMFASRPANVGMCTTPEDELTRLFDMAGLK